MHRYNQPNPALAPYVRSILTIDRNGGNVALPVIPQATPAMIYMREADQQVKQADRLLLFGKAVDARFFREHHNTSLIAYFFHPFVVGPLFDLSARKFSNDPIDLLERNAGELGWFRERIAELETATECLEVLDAFLYNQLLKNHERCEIIRIATDRILERQDTCVLTDALNELNISERTLQRLFKKFVGVSPNKFRRLCQFQSAFEQLRMGQFEELSDVAFEQGYADQSHFGRSFREYTQRSPHEYVKRGLRTEKS